MPPPTPIPTSSLGILIQQVVGMDQRIFVGEVVELHAGDCVLVVHGLLGGADGKGEW